jgi:hypothetical protein
MPLVARPILAYRIVAEPCLTDKTLITQFHAFMGTPAYTSPKQMEMSGSISIRALDHQCGRTGDHAHLRQFQSPLGCDLRGAHQRRFSFLDELHNRSDHGLRVSDQLMRRVLLPQSNGGLVCVSARGKAGTGNDTLIIGFVVGAGPRVFGSVALEACS